MRDMPYMAPSDEALRANLATARTIPVSRRATEVLVARAHEKFDADGRLTDEATRPLLRQFLDTFHAWATAHLRASR
jgi:hypothetical protein